MIPRITVREPTDALYLVMAVHHYMHQQLEWLNNEMRKPGADKHYLTMTAIHEMEFAKDLVAEIRESVVPDTENQEG